jgi:hypothetical protein
MLTRIILARIGIGRPPMQRHAETAYAALLALEKHLAAGTDRRAVNLAARLHRTLQDAVEAAPPGAIDLAPLSAVPKPE